METALNPAAQGDAADASVCSMWRAAANVCLPRTKASILCKGWIPTARDVCLNGDWRQAACAQSIPNHLMVQMGNGTYTSLFFHSFMLKASQSPHSPCHWLIQPWDAPGTPRSLGRPRNTERYGSVEEGASSAQINGWCCILALTTAGSPITRELPRYLHPGFPPAFAACC